MKFRLVFRIKRTRAPLGSSNFAQVPAMSRQIPAPKPSSPATSGKG